MLEISFPQIKTKINPDKTYKSFYIKAYRQGRKWFSDGLFICENCNQFFWGVKNNFPCCPKVYVSN